MEGSKLKKETRSRIKGYLEGFITGLLEEVTKTEVKPRDLRPITTEVEPGDCNYWVVVF
jgi:hypothetical protein